MSIIILQLSLYILFKQVQRFSWRVVLQQIILNPQARIITRMIFLFALNISVCKNEQDSFGPIEITSSMLLKRIRINLWTHRMRIRVKWVWAVTAKANCAVMKWSWVCESHYERLPADHWVKQSHFISSRDQRGKRVTFSNHSLKWFLDWRFQMLSWKVMCALKMNYEMHFVMT